MVDTFILILLQDAALIFLEDCEMAPTLRDRQWRTALHVCAQNNSLNVSESHYR